MMLKYYFCWGIQAASCNVDDLISEKKNTLSCSQNWWLVVCEWGVFVRTFEIQINTFFSNATWIFFNHLKMFTCRDFLCRIGRCVFFRIFINMSTRSFVLTGFSSRKGSGNSSRGQFQSLLAVLVSCAPFSEQVDTGIPVSSHGYGTLALPASRLLSTSALEQSKRGWGSSLIGSNQKKF